MKRKSLPHPQGSQDMGTAYTHTHVERHPWKIRVSLELTRFGLCPGPPSYPAPAPTSTGRVCCLALDTGRQGLARAARAGLQPSCNVSARPPDLCIAQSVPGLVPGGGCQVPS